ncbi:SdpI family protein [Marinoscillum sp. MHG1-6]|uniref:SdpI family protein n=1 Tax=Marinoscillum sp. MHG1-6 TaxID=2959627 RepID=UPI00215732C7|nr:SdpI family protein [Marinoscillum sp. MHG1-6]
MTRFLSGNRNWLFGYRSTMSMKSHKHFDYANRIMGTATAVFGLLYLGLLILSEKYTYIHLSNWINGVIVFGFFAILILVVELLLRQKFGDK